LKAFQPNRATDVVVVGGGAAGTLAALKLAGIAGVGCITVLDRDGRFGRGVAYSAVEPWHRINVPAAKMGGSDNDDPHGFSNWLIANHHALGPDYTTSFVPRNLYGDYLCGLLEPLLSRGRIDARHCEARAIDRDGSKYLVTTSDGDRIEANAIILCLGNQQPGISPSIEPSPRLVGDVWASDALTGIGPASDVLIAGTGATAVDVVLDLVNRGMGHHITMISRHGLVPCTDVVPVEDTTPFKADGITTMRTLLGALRVDVRAKIARGMPWQSVIDGFRPKASGLWQTVSDAERARFIRHLRTFWMIHRHRLAPDVADLIVELQRKGRLRMIAGQLKRAMASASGYDVVIKPRGAALVHVSADWLVNCMGSEERYDRLHDPLVRSLFSSGRARLGPMGLGLAVDRHCTLLDAEAKPQPGIYLVGPATRGCFWEVTSLPGIREQVMRVGAHLALGTGG
jgi:uncharacterized NAD(P)/FAD-binding protein YdhS